MAKKQPVYPVKEMVTYRLGDMICQHPICSKPFDEYVRQAREIWGDQYDYYEDKYTYGKRPITIHCRKHDYDFTVGMAQNHLMKHNATGCPICSYEKQYGENYGTEWRDFLEPTPNQNRVRAIRKPRKDGKTPKQIAREKRERERRKQRQEAKRKKREALMQQYGAKSEKELNFLIHLQNEFPDMYDTHLVDYKDRDLPLTLICKEHGEFKITARQLFGYGGKRAHGCWQCAGLTPPWEKEKNRMTEEEFFHKIHKLYDATELDFMTSEYHSLNKNVTAYCRKHGAITHPASYWLEGKGCEYCNGKFYAPDFLRLAREVHGNKYQYRGIKKIKSMASKIKIHCDNPNHHWWTQRVDRHLYGDGCRECAGRHQTLDERKINLLERVKEKFGDGRFQIAIDEYTTTHKPIHVTCLEHNYTYKIAPDILLNGAGGCPYCTASEGEAVIKGWLDNRGIPHIWHFQIPNEDPTLPLQYVEPDFWLEQLNLFIEFHGQQHYEDIGHFYWGRVRNFAVQQHRDRYLRGYCERHGHELLEIPYTEFKRIDEILTEEILVKRKDNC